MIIITCIHSEKPCNNQNIAQMKPEVSFSVFCKEDKTVGMQLV